MRVQKFLSEQGIASRRQAEKMIKNGDIKVNDVLAEIGQKIDPSVDVVKFRNKIVNSATKDPVIYLFHKPVGVTSTNRFYKGEKNVMSYFKGKGKLIIAGRLDKDSRGLMILTNDGEVANELMHPKFKSEKEYIVTIDEPIDDISLKRLRKGIKYEGVEYNTISVRVLGQKKLRFVLGEGKKRHIRMMLKACRLEVRDLFRKRINEYEIGDLKPGQYKEVEIK